MRKKEKLLIRLKNLTINKKGINILYSLLLRTHRRSSVAGPMSPVSVAAVPRRPGARSGSPEPGRRSHPRGKLPGVSCAQDFLGVGDISVIRIEI